jgi:hypothetical protein
MRYCRTPQFIGGDWYDEMTSDNQTDSAHNWREWWAQAKQQAEEARQAGRIEDAEAFDAMLAAFDTLDHACDVELIKLLKT